MKLSLPLKMFSFKESIRRGAAPDTAGTAVAVPEFLIISSVFGETLNFVGKLTISSVSEAYVSQT